MYEVIVVTVVGALMFLNEATLLHNVRFRYMKNAIYVSSLTHLLYQAIV